MKKEIKGKSWVLLFLLVVFIGLGSYMALNYYVNPLGYFTNEKGLDYFYTDDFARSIKMKYLKKHPEIDAVILGGSKAGAFNPERFSEYTGHTYYNMFFNVGNWADYLRYSQYLVEKADIKEITLHLSSYDVSGYDRTGIGNNTKVPAILSGNPFKEAQEFLMYLVTDINTTRKTLKKRPKMGDTDKDDLLTGMKGRIPVHAAMHEDLQDYAENHILGATPKMLTSLFGDALTVNNEDERQIEARQKGIEALRKIKQLCDDNDVTLKVVIGADYVANHTDYECADYNAYLQQIVGIVGEVWDFSDYNSINMNPYNFYNSGHNTMAVADLETDIMYGKDSFEGFGILLTPDNIQEYSLPSLTVR